MNIREKFSYLIIFNLSDKNGERQKERKRLD